MPVDPTLLAVIVVLAVILAGLFAWMLFLDRRISKWEKHLKK